MRTYLLISGAWLAVAAAAAFAYARLAAFGAGSDAHHFEPRPLQLIRRRRHGAGLAVPAWIFGPLAVGCVAAVLMADFALAPEGVPTIPDAMPSQSVRLAEVAPAEPRPAPRKPRRAAPRQVSSGLITPAAAVPVTAPAPRVTAAPRFVRTAPARPRRSGPRPAAPVSPPAPAPAAAAAVATPVPSSSPVPEPAASAQPEPAPSPEPDPGSPPAQGGGTKKKRTVHPPSKSVPGRVHRPKAPVGRPRCACR